MSTTSPATPTPNANSPRTLHRIVHWLARGLRSSRALQEAMGLDLRTIQYYLTAAEWLGFVEPGPERLLTPAGLELAFGDEPDAAYARALWHQPLIAALMEEGRRTTMPDVDEVMLAIARSDPELSPVTVRRRASAVRSLIAPALDFSRRLKPADPQLVLPIPAPDKEPLRERLAISPKVDADPDVYRFVYGAMLDFGELTLGQLRGLLDRAGGQELALGTYVDLAIQRGDISRVGDRLVVTAGAIERRDIASSTAGIILSHPGYRTWLRDLRAAEVGDRNAEIRRSDHASRYKHWDDRLFGRIADVATLDLTLPKMVLDRGPDNYPIAGDAGPPVSPTPASYLHVWDEPDQIVSLPPYLAVLEGGLPAANSVLQAARQGTRDVAPPDASARPVVVHGGLLHPGESLPRSIPDVLSLRHRTLLNAPYAAATTALLILHRLRPDRYSLRLHRHGWRVFRGRRSLGPLLDVLDTFFRDRGQLPCRRSGKGLPAETLLGGLHTLRIACDVGGCAVLDERMFHHLRHDPELLELHQLLLPFADALEVHLDALDPLEDGARRER